MLSISKGLGELFFRCLVVGGEMVNLPWWGCDIGHSSIQQHMVSIEIQYIVSTLCRDQTYTVLCMVNDKSSIFTLLHQY